MRRFLIILSLGLVVLCFVKGSQANPEDALAVTTLNDTVDRQIQTRLLSLQLGAELSAAIEDSKAF
jgi:hypothetical protein